MLATTKLHAELVHGWRSKYLPAVKSVTFPQIDIIQIEWELTKNSSVQKDFVAGPQQMSSSAMSQFVQGSH